jgi:hypothetical protein
MVNLKNVEMGIEAPLMKDSDGAIFNKFYEVLK